jgi:hypothetical protein
VLAILAGLAAATAQDQAIADDLACVIFLVCHGPSDG